MFVDRGDAKPAMHASKAEDAAEIFERGMDRSLEVIEVIGRDAEAVKDLDVALA
jgi:hypothetical protein